MNKPVTSAAPKRQMSVGSNASRTEEPEEIAVIEMPIEMPIETASHYSSEPLSPKPPNGKIAIQFVI